MTSSAKTLRALDRKRVDDRARFEAWFKISYPIFEREGRDTTIKHQLWTAWQAANLDHATALKRKRTGRR